MRARLIQNHPNRADPNLWRKPVHRFAHGGSPSQELEPPAIPRRFIPFWLGLPKTLNLPSWANAKFTLGRTARLGMYSRTDDHWFVLA
jgi:hypothetical protein